MSVLRALSDAVELPPGNPRAEAWDVECGEAHKRWGVACGLLFSNTLSYHHVADGTPRPEQWRGNWNMPEPDNVCAACGYRKVAYVQTRRMEPSPMMPPDHLVQVRRLVQVCECDA
eukprot:gene15173-18390_t